MARIIIINNDGYQYDMYSDLRDILTDEFHTEFPRKMQDNFSESFSGLKFSIMKYINKLDKLISEGSPDLDHYISELKGKERWGKDFVVEFYDIELYYHFKSFIINSKDVLDRLVPFFDYKNNSKLKKFSKKGKKLINYLERNPKCINRKESIALISSNKSDWLDDLITIRDKLIHFSSGTSEYISFSYLIKEDSGKLIKGINDFNPPFVINNEYSMPAMDFLNTRFNYIKTFCKDFIKLCIAQN